MSQSSVTMNLLIDTQAKRVLFAEAGKDCVDFLFYILSLPLATVVTLLEKQGMVGSVSNLYESIESLNDSYLLPNQTKKALLEPVVSPFSGSCVPLLDISGASSSTAKKFYRCRGNNNVHGSSPFGQYSVSSPFAQCSGSSPIFGQHSGSLSIFGQQSFCSGFNHVCDDPRAACPNCGKCMDTPLNFVEYHHHADVVMRSGEGGFVKGLLNYMVMDDLVVKPMSTVSSITLLNKFDVKNVRVLEEKVVNLGMTEAVELLKASLETKNVLTQVFLSG